MYITRLRWFGVAAAHWNWTNLVKHFKQTSQEILLHSSYLQCHIKSRSNQRIMPNCTVCYPPRNASKKMAQRRQSNLFLLIIETQLFIVTTLFSNLTKLRKRLQKMPFLAFKNHKNNRLQQIIASKLSSWKKLRQNKNLNANAEMCLRIKMKTFLFRLKKTSSIATLLHQPLGVVTMSAK